MVLSYTTSRDTIPDYALVLFFDSVFDAGLNEAVKWDSYWTPLRYLIIHKLSVLFDESLLRESWRLCTEKKIERYKDDIVKLLSELKRRVGVSGLDARSIELIADALDFGIARPLDLDFGCPDHKMISPNAVGFQFVVSCIARRVRRKGRKKASSIIIDRQHQFNNVQIGTHYNRVRIAEGLKNVSHKEKGYYLNHPLYATLDKEDLLHKGLPGRGLTISRSMDSIGLQLVDVYLWIANKVFSGEELPVELARLWYLFARRSTVDGISLAGMRERFMEFERMLPRLEDVTCKQRVLAQELVDKHRAKVRDINKVSGA